VVDEISEKVQKSLREREVVFESSLDIQLAKHRGRVINGSAFLFPHNPKG
jgi:hypothetical protein